MCLGIPMRIEQIDGFQARCSANGVEREINLYLLQGHDVAVGDYVMTHVGYAIQTLTETEARTRWELFDELLSQAPERDA